MLVFKHRYLWSTKTQLLLTFSLFIVIINQVSHFWRGLLFLATPCIWPGLCKNRYSCHHKPTVFLRKQSLVGLDCSCIALTIGQTIHVKTSQVVASLQTSCPQVVLTRLLASCKQVLKKLLTTCSNLSDIIRLFTILFYRTSPIPSWYTNKPCVVSLVTVLFHQYCTRLAKEMYALHCGWPCLLMHYFVQFICSPLGMLSMRHFEQLNNSSITILDCKNTVFYHY